MVVVLDGTGILPQESRACTMWPVYDSSEAGRGPAAADPSPVPPSEQLTRRAPVCLPSRNGSAVHDRRRHGASALDEPARGRRQAVEPTSGISGPIVSRSTITRSAVMPSRIRTPIDEAPARRRHQRQHTYRLLEGERLLHERRPRDFDMGVHSG